MLKIALIGYGYWGSKLARNFQNLEVFKLISIADIMSKNLSLAKKNYPLVKISNDYKNTIKNNGNKSLSGVATYNVLPYEAGKYFNKVDCFCFENQTLDPGEEVLLPVNFYIDTKILEDPAIKHLDTIVLSYTFFQSNENSEKNLKNKK